MSFKDFLIFLALQAIFFGEQNTFCSLVNFGRGFHEKLSLYLA